MTPFFPSFAPEDPLWQFPLAAPLEGAQETELLSRIQAFLPTWKTHGRPVRGEVVCVANRVILVAGQVQGGISGCGQDALRHAVEEACAALHVLFAPPLSFWVFSELQGWRLYTRAELKKALLANTLDASALLVDGTKNTVGTLAPDIVVPIAETWASVFLPASALPS